MSRWRVSLALLACTAVMLVVAVACGDGNDEKSPSPTQPAATGATTPANNSGTNNGGGTNSTASPKLDGPASKYSLLNPEDFQAGFITNLQVRNEFDAKGYGSTRIFASPEKGEAQLKQWGYEGGFQSGVDPENREQAMLNGAWGVLQEVHLFADEAGAHEAFLYFKDKLGAGGAGAAVGIPPVGNESTAWQVVSGKIASTQVNMAYYVILFRRGNLVATVVANGAETLIDSETARQYAVMIDQKALGQRNTMVPTPSANTARTNPTNTPAASGR